MSGSLGMVISYEAAAAWFEWVETMLVKVAAADCGPVTWLVTPKGLARIGCSRLELVTHAFREQGMLPWPDGSWTGGKAPWS